MVRLLVIHCAERLLVITAATAICLAQSEAGTIRVETREVVLPVKVVQVKVSTVTLPGPDLNLYEFHNYHSKEITKLSVKSFHLFEDGIEQKVQHLSLENDDAWVAKDNAGLHLEYSCTPKGIWEGGNLADITKNMKNASFGITAFYHTNLVTYVPPSSPKGSCHRISIRVDDKHATIFAPGQYCNTKDPLSDPVNGTEIGNGLLEFAQSGHDSGTLPLALQLSAMPNSAGEYRVNISSEMSANLFQRKWEGINLRTSIAILGLVYDKNNALVFRFSDTACRPAEVSIGINGPVPADNAPAPWFSEGKRMSEEWVIPTTYQTQLELVPGDYRLELVITDGEKFGRATASFRLDDLVKEPLAISGIALCKKYRQASDKPRSPSQAPQYVPLVFDGTEFTPSGDTRFHKGEPFISYFEVSRRTLEGDVTANLETRVTDAKTGEVRLDSGLQPLKLSILPTNGSTGVVRNVSIDTLSPGTYRLEAQVSDSQGHKTAWSSASFTVE